MVTKFLSLTKLKSQFQSTHIDLLWQTYNLKLKIYMYMYLQGEKGACRGFLPAPQVDLLLSNTCKVLNSRVVQKSTVMFALYPQ